jgi:hypothetical protein
VALVMLSLAARPAGGRAQTPREARGAARPAAADSAGAWLDAHTLTNWNDAYRELPSPPAATGEPAADRCEDEGRAAGRPEERQVTEAGWSLFGEPHTRGGTAVVVAANGADEMCRPLDLQAFVFVDGRFAGTLAPHPMQARTDGVLDRIQMFESTLRADFNRYAAADPPCCPSRTSTVSYRLVADRRGPLLVPDRVGTVPKPRKKK